MARACLLIRQSVQYRTEAFRSGLHRLGYEVAHLPPRGLGNGDVLILWNWQLRFERTALDYEKAGGTIIVAENGWVGCNGEGNKLVSLCKGHHNGAGEWTVGAAGRWRSQGVTLAPWRVAGERIMVLGQRGIGELGVAAPARWVAQTVEELRRRTVRPIELREHPGRHIAPDPDFSGVHAVVTWSSGAAIKAIVAGVPAFHAFPQWIGAAAARPLDHDLDDPFLGDRQPMLDRLAWAQWTIAEIASGEAFSCLLQSPVAENAPN